MQVYRCTGIQPYRYTGIQVYRYVQYLYTGTPGWHTCITSTYTHQTALLFVITSLHNLLWCMRACVPATWALLTRASSQPCHMQLPFSSSSEQSTVTCSKKKNTPSAMLLERKQVLCSSCNQNASANAFSRYHLNRHFAAKHPLVCQACQKDGCTFRNHHRYQCTEPSCGRLLGCKAFKRKQLYNYL